MSTSCTKAQRAQVESPLYAETLELVTSLCQELQVSSVCEADNVMSNEETEAQRQHSCKKQLEARGP